MISIQKYNAEVLWFKLLLECMLVWVTKLRF